MVAFSPELPLWKGGNKKPAVPHSGFGKIQVLELRLCLARMAQLARFATLFGSGHAQFGGSTTLSARTSIGMSGFRIINVAKLRQRMTAVKHIIRKNSPYRRAEFDRRQQVSREGAAFWITSKEDLIISKLCWAKDSESELQLRDVRNLAETGYDQTYLDHWIKELDLEVLWKKCL
jgi:hypothetical protein